MFFSRTSDNRLACLGIKILHSFALTKRVNSKNHKPFLDKVKQRYLIHIPTVSSCTVPTTKQNGWGRFLQFIRDKQRPCHVKSRERFINNEFHGKTILFYRFCNDCV